MNNLRREKNSHHSYTDPACRLRKYPLGMLIIHHHQSSLSSYHHHFYLILDSPPKLLQAGKFNATNVIVGVTRDDGGNLLKLILGKNPIHLSHDY